MRTLNSKSGLVGCLLLGTVATLSGCTQYADDDSEGSGRGRTGSVDRTPSTDAPSTTNGATSGSTNANGTSKTNAPSTNAPNTNAPNSARESQLQITGMSPSTGAFGTEVHLDVNDPQGELRGNVYVGVEVNGVVSASARVAARVEHGQIIFNYPVRTDGVLRVFTDYGSAVAGTFIPTVKAAVSEDVKLAGNVVGAFSPAIGSVWAFVGSQVVKSEGDLKAAALPAAALAGGLSQSATGGLEGYFLAADGQVRNVVWDVTSSLPQVGSTNLSLPNLNAAGGNVPCTIGKDARGFVAWVASTANNTTSWTQYRLNGLQATVARTIASPEGLPQAPASYLAPDGTFYFAYGKHTSTLGLLSVDDKAQPMVATLAPGAASFTVTPIGDAMDDDQVHTAIHPAPDGTISVSYCVVDTGGNDQGPLPYHCGLTTRGQNGGWTRSQVISSATPPVWGLAGRWQAAVDTAQNLELLSNAGIHLSVGVSGTVTVPKLLTYDAGGSLVLFAEAKASAGGLVIFTQR